MKSFKVGDKVYHKYRSIGPVKGVVVEGPYKMGKDKLWVLWEDEGKPRWIPVEDTYHDKPRRKLPDWF